MMAKLTLSVIYHLYEHARIFLSWEHGFADFLGNVAGFNWQRCTAGSKVAVEGTVVTSEEWGGGASHLFGQQLSNLRCLGRGSGAVAKAQGETPKETCVHTEGASTLARCGTTQPLPVWPNGA